MTIAAIVLAAGSSSRMGRPKQLLDIGGQTLLSKTIQTLLTAGISRIVVVLGANEVMHRDSIRTLPVDVVVNREWERGMGSSLKAGLARVLSCDATPEGVIISVCDQPLLEPENIAALAAEFRQTGTPIIASGYGNTPGVPVLFHRKYFSALASLSDHEGAKKIILQQPAEVKVVAFPGGETDLDTMDDYERFLNNRMRPPLGRK